MDSLLTCRRSPTRSTQLPVLQGGEEQRHIRIRCQRTHQTRDGGHFLALSRSICAAPFYLAAYVRCWISSHRARDPQRDRAAFHPRRSRTASEPQGNGIEFASENPGIAAGGRATCLQNEGISGTSNAKSSLRRPGNPFFLHRRFHTHGAPETAFPRHAPRG